MTSLFLTDELEQTFKALHFHVITHKLLSVRDVLSTLREVAHQQGHYRASAFVCCIISRSHSSDLLATDSHGPGLNLDTVRRLFTSDSCRAWQASLNSSLSRAMMCPSLRGVLDVWGVKMTRVESWRQTGLCSYAARELSQWMRTSSGVTAGLEENSWRCQTISLCT